jgi:tellurite methyltransferase
MTKQNPYDRRYAGQGYYWGKNPSKICEQVLEYAPPASGRRLKLLDLGCGEGRNAVYLAVRGFEVDGLDSSPAGLDRTRAYAEESGVCVQTIHADVCEYELTDTYDVIFSTGTLHYLPSEIRAGRFEHFKEHTSASGLNVFSVFVEKPFIARAPDAEDTAHLYRSGELMSYYWDWEILFSIEEVFDCMSSGIPHQHAVNRIIARKRSDAR